MTAPEEFSRNRNTVSGETYAAITLRKPTTVEARIAQTGHAPRVDRDQPHRRLAPRGQHEEHPGGRVEPRVEAGQHGGEHDGVHDVVGVRDAHLA